MSKCYILGAGFSNAVSGLPVMKELTKAFWQVLEQEKNKGHNNRTFWGNRIRHYFEFLENDFFVRPCISGKYENYEECNFQENLEALISFIDLNVSGEITASVIDKDGNRGSYSKPTLFWNFTDLEELRTCIQTYIYLAFIQTTIKKEILNPFIQRISQNDKLITFNYDLIVEKALYERDIWKPKDGYGIAFKEFHGIADFHKSKSEVHIYKLHGSLNWEKDVGLQFFYDNNEPIFPGYLLEDSKSPQYQGKKTGLWIMPSFIKQFLIPELLDIWQNAFSAIKEAEEIIVIGYSLPKEDSAACLLFGTTNIADKRLILVDPNADNLLEKYRTVTHNRNIKTFKSIENFLNNS